jgi:hypothetical protein
MDRGMELLFALLLLVLPVSALAARRLPGRQMLLMGAAWVAIFGVAILLMSALGFT